MAVIYNTLRTLPTAWRMTDKQVAYYNAIVAQVHAIDPKASIKLMTPERISITSKSAGSSEIDFAKSALAYAKSRAR